MINLLITSPKNYAKRMVRALEKREVRVQFLPFCSPMIQTEIAIDSPAFKDFLDSLDKFDYVAFSSRKAIEAFAKGLSEAQANFPLSLKLCAIGKDNEELVKSLHVKPAFVSAEPSPKGIVDHLGKLPDVIGKCIAVLAPEVVGMEEPSVIPDFLSGLENIGMCPTRVNAYRTIAAEVELLERTSRKIREGEYDAVVFTSGLEIKVFRKMVPEGMPIEVFLKHLKVVCYGPYTARCAEQCGIRVDFVSSFFGSFDGFIVELQNYYQNLR